MSGVGHLHEPGSAEGQVWFVSRVSHGSRSARDRSDDPNLRGRMRDQLLRRASGTSKQLPAAVRTNKPDQSPIDPLSSHQSPVFVGFVPGWETFGISR